MSKRDSRNPGPKRVFHLIKSLGRGGAEMLLVASVPFVPADEYTYAFGYFLPWKDALVPALSAGAEVTCFSARNNAAMLAQVPAVARHLKRWDADVLHCHLPMASIVGRLAGRLAGVPVISTEHNVLERYHPATRALTLATWRLQSRVIAVSEEVASSIARATKGSVPVDVVRNGVPVNLMQRDVAGAARIRASLGIPEGAPVAGIVAVFRTQKRLPLWLEVAAQVRRAHPNAHFIFVGDGPLRAEVEAKIKSLSLGDCVHLVGLQEDVRPYVSAMDVFLMTSEFEGLPVALLEAMAMETSPVVTAVGGMPEAVADGVSGFVLAPSDTPGLVSAVNRLFADDALRLRVGKSARERVDREFGMQRMLGEVHGVYEKVLAAGDAP
jgi:glycosyltransferase involved in cell wall biosynthesis